MLVLGVSVRFRIRFKVSIVTAIFLIITVMTLATLANVWVVSSRTAKVSAGSLFESVSQNARVRLDRLASEVLLLANLGATQANMTSVVGNGLEAPPLPLLIDALKENAALYSLYYGFADGSFLQVISVSGDERIMTTHNAPDGTRWILRTITNSASDGSTTIQASTPGQRTQTWTFLSQTLKPLGETIEPSPEYDPRKRPWYGSAIDQGMPRLSAPYVFNSLRQPGLTASKRLTGGRGVFGVDVTLTELSSFISALDISKNGGIILSDDKGRILSMTPRFGSYQLLEPLANISVAAVKAAEIVRLKQAKDGLYNIDQDGTNMMVRQMNWQTGGRRLHISAVAPMNDFVSHILTMQNQIIALVLLGLAVLIPFAVIFSNRMGRSVSELAIDANRVRNLDFSGAPPSPSRIIEFHELGASFSLMKSDLSTRTNALEVAESKLSRLVELGIALSAEHNSDKLMEMVLLGAKELTNAEGGTLYIIGEDNMLHSQIVHDGVRGITRGRLSENDADFPPVPMYNEDGQANYNNVVSYAVHEGETVNIADAHDASTFDFSGTRAFDERNNYRSTSFITVPLRPRGGDIIGALQLVNAREPGVTAVVPFPSEIQRFVESLAAQAATALYNRNLLDAQEHLTDSMIELIAGAIDTKSPYTGGHCARVPELAIMLAEEACQTEEGVLADFQFQSDDEWREFRIGAWLHDCGKVVTPEYVVDKATKLETIYNRIHEIRTRFEVLLRDAKIEQLDAVIDGSDPQAMQDRFDQRKTQLTEQFAFIANSNIGGEFMGDETIERLNEIAKTTWQRSFDVRLGLSHVELERYQDVASDLPATEKLLDDKPYHIYHRDDAVQKSYDALGFNMNVPEHLYNLGELTNLSIRRGTLSEEERFKINEHIAQTIAMLDHLPFPKHLQRVPEYAGTHHEMLNGGGYPRGLSESELSIPARIMAISDIFEALTASDRPYKKPKSLSDSVKTLSHFKHDGHIDPVLFDLFLTSGVYRRYAERYLDPAQIDDVDITQFIG